MFNTFSTGTHSLPTRHLSSGPELYQLPDKMRPQPPPAWPVLLVHCCAPHLLSHTPHIRSHAALTVPSGFSCNVAKTLCIKHMAAATPHSAVTACSALAARVCLHVDFMELCGDPVMIQPFTDRATGMYGDKEGGDNSFGTWNQDSCNPNNDGARITSTPTSGEWNYSCCRYGELRAGYTVEDSDCGAMTDSIRLGAEICTTSVQSAATAHNAIGTCRGNGGHVCLHGEMQQLCGSGSNPYDDVTSGWYGDHGIASGGNTDDEYCIWSSASCASNNDGIPAQSGGNKAFRCCRAPDSANGGTLPKTCDHLTGFDLSGGICWDDPNPSETKTMSQAIEICWGLRAHVCTHVEMQSIGATTNPYGEQPGWYGNHGVNTDWDDEYMTWNGANVANNNDGAPRASTESSLPFRCCALAALPCLPGYHTYNEGSCTGSYA